MAETASAPGPRQARGPRAAFGSTTVQLRRHRAVAFGCSSARLLARTPSRTLVCPPRRRPIGPASAARAARCGSTPMPRRQLARPSAPQPASAHRRQEYGSYQPRFLPTTVLTNYGSYQLRFLPTTVLTNGAHAIVRSRTTHQATPSSSCARQPRATAGNAMTSGPLRHGLERGGRWQ